ncbi:hypothetical protein GEOBRER4_n2767 [Citrifermentans bremense]|uniref:Uncharacterized protein n=1 Tax=Citrifermentans bremense TaxID=60035 RepID=A0A6S6M7T7_9BACT|nr:hypothetical protein [Citrifermentans bremense]BCG47916.1 hypothetical protein GEOBRER4_n2767 [Citrifermentans bremense]
MADSLFPAVEKYIENEGLLNKMKGYQAQLYRIMGQGSTRAKGLDLPPASIERRIELVSFKPLQDASAPKAIIAEIDQIRRELERELSFLKKTDEQKKLANQVLRGLGVSQSGIKDNRFYVGRLILSCENSGRAWTWSLTPHYPIIENIPPDLNYIQKAYFRAEELFKEILLAPDIFEEKLNLSWLIARHFSTGEKVLIIDVARMFKVAGQSEKFWSTPKKATFVDLVDAAFIANLINWMKQSGERSFSFSQATLHQAHGKHAKAFYLPVNTEGTQTRPVIYIDKK